MTQFLPTSSIIFQLVGTEKKLGEFEGREGKGRREGEFPTLSLSLDWAINAQSKAAGTWGLCLPDDNTTLEGKPAAAVLRGPLEGSACVKQGQGLFLPFPSEDHLS